MSHCQYCKQPMRPGGTNLRDYPGTVATRRVNPPTCKRCGKLEDSQIKKHTSRATEQVLREQEQALREQFEREARRRFPAERTLWFIKDTLKTCHPSNVRASEKYKLGRALGTLRQIKQLIEKENTK